MKRGLFLEMSGLIFLRLLQRRGRTGRGVSLGDPGTQHPKHVCSRSHYVGSPYMSMDRAMVQMIQ